MILIDWSAAAALAPADPEERAGAEGMERGRRRVTEEETGRRRRGRRARRKRRRKKTVEWLGGGIKISKGNVLLLQKYKCKTCVLLCQYESVYTMRMKGIIPPLFTSPHGVRHPF